MLDQPFMTDIIEASSISHMPQVIDIYSASWGPTDNGKTVDGPRELTLQAMADGVNKVTVLKIWVLGQNGVYMLVLKTVTWEHNAFAQIIKLSPHFKVPLMLTLQYFGIDFILSIVSAYCVYL